ncbi:MAG: hypothetical protein AAF985_10865 [Bacteroidota bacterium]
MKDQQNQYGSSFRTWMSVGVGLGMLFTYMIGNLAIGVMMGLCLSFLIGICCNRLVSKAL